MKLYKLTDRELLNNTRELIRRERALLTQILHHLREIERRRLFSDLGRQSLFDYAVRELGYSEDQAYRRLNAMRLLREMPHIEKNIAEGSLTLSSLSIAGSLFKAEAKYATAFSKQKKIEVLEALTNKSRKESKKIVRQFSTLPAAQLRPEKITETEDGEEWRLNAPTSLVNKVARVKAILAHSHPNATHTEIYEKLCDDFLARHEQKTAAKSAQSRNTAPKSTKAANKITVNARQTISAGLRRQVWQRDGGKCTKCGSVHAIEIDHILPVAHGGLNTLENLRLLCRSCNQREAIVKMGQDKMDAHLHSRAK